MQQSFFPVEREIQNLTKLVDVLLVARHSSVRSKVTLNWIGLIDVFWGGITFSCNYDLNETIDITHIF